MSVRVLSPHEVRSAGADLDKADRAILRPSKVARLAGAACHQLADLIPGEIVAVEADRPDSHGFCRAQIECQHDGRRIRTGLAWWHGPTGLLVDRMDTY